VHHLGLVGGLARDHESLRKAQGRAPGGHVHAG
jgi:hypothetical protein